MSDRTAQFFVVRTTGPMAWLIRRVTRSRFNHAGVCISDSLTVEAEARGAIIGDLDRYSGDAIAFSNYALTECESDAIVRAALDLLGTPYNFGDLLWLAMMQCPGLRWRWVERLVSDTSAMVCSQLVAYCYEQVGIVFNPACPQDVTPADLAREIAVEP